MEFPLADDAGDGVQVKSEKSNGTNQKGNEDGARNILAFPRFPLPFTPSPCPLSRDQESFDLLDPLRAESVFLG